MNHETKSSMFSEALHAWVHSLEQDWSIPSVISCCVFLRGLFSWALFGCLCQYISLCWTVGTFKVTDRNAIHSVVARYVYSNVMQHYKRSHYIPAASSGCCHSFALLSRSARLTVAYPWWNSCIHFPWCQPNLNWQCFYGRKNTQQRGWNHIDAVVFFFIFSLMMMLWWKPGPV